MPDIIELAAVNVHTHLRDYNESYKEDLDTGTRAAVAGGFTTVFDMPNTDPPLANREALRHRLIRAEQKVNCFYGAYAVAMEDNAQGAAEAAELARGLKIYLDNTHGSLYVRKLSILIEHFKAWPRTKPIVCHAEDISLPLAIGLATTYSQHLHVAHVTQASEIELIRDAKQRGLRVTCEVAPHHLFLTQADAKRLGAYGYMKPELATQADVDALWANFDVIDCIADDHAPHTIEEKEGDNPPPGVPGLETTLPLMFNAVREGRITLDDLLPKVTNNPRRIFRIPEPRETYAVIDLDHTYTISNEGLHTKVGWSPFEGMPAAGLVRRAVVYGQTVYKDGDFQPIEASRLVLGG